MEENINPEQSSEQNQSPVETPETKKVNKPMFWVGIAMIAVAAILFLTVEKDLGLTPSILGLLGLMSIGASRYRPMK